MRIQAEVIEQKMKLLREKEEAKLKAMQARQEALAINKTQAAAERAVAKAAAAKHKEIVNLCTKVLTKTSAVKTKVAITLNSSQSSSCEQIPSHVAADLQTAQQDIEKLEKLATKYMPGDKQVDAKGKTFLQGVEDHVKAAEKAVKLYNGFAAEAAKVREKLE